MRVESSLLLIAVIMIAMALEVGKQIWYLILLCTNRIGISFVCLEYYIGGMLLDEMTCERIPVVIATAYRC